MGNLTPSPPGYILSETRNHIGAVAPHAKIRQADFVITKLKALVVYVHKRQAFPVQHKP